MGWWASEQNIAWRVMEWMEGIPLRLFWLKEHLRCNYFCPQFKNFWSKRCDHLSEPGRVPQTAFKACTHLRRELGDRSFGDLKKVTFFAIAQALFLREKTWHLQNSFCHFLVLNILLPKTKQEETWCQIGLCKILSTRIKSLSHTHKKTCLQKYWEMAVP